MSWKFLFMIFRKVTQISSRKKSVIRWNHCFEDVFEFTNQRSGFILSSNVPILPNTMKTFVKRSFQKEWNSIWKAHFQMQHVYVDFFLYYAMTLIWTQEQKHKVSLSLFKFQTMINWFFSIYHGSFFLWFSKK